MNIKQNPIPNTISIPMDVKESARHIIRIQYIRVKYNSIPLIMSENVFISTLLLSHQRLFYKLLDYFSLEKYNHNQFWNFLRHL